MKIMKNHTILTHNAVRARTVWARLKGLLGRPALSPNEALVLSPCSSIHTFFMRFPIDAIFIDSCGKVLHLYSHLKPNRMSGLHWRAKEVIEVPSGTIEQWKVQVGDILKCEEDDNV
ncbi:MAG: DUF192 domain-containing protein [Deltaproteobacteria bacterium]|nr:DUF192 domain-containing protein [Deltaproteobacteria bacterium]MBI3016992.1 DUF192 domain-containing protein [Deltaproteobacteria bacterium]